MFKGENQQWIYLIGIFLMFVFLGLVTRDFLYPLFIEGETPQNTINPVVETSPNFIINTNVDYIATVNTNLGEFTIDLFENSAPNNVNNFVYLSDLDYYNGTYFHRLIPGLLIQGGDPNSKDENPDNDGLGGPGYVIKDEINLLNLNISEDQRSKILKDGYKSNPDVTSSNLSQYSIALANDGPDTNGSQFFIILADDRDTRVQKMNGKFTVIGQVISGFNVLEIFANSQVDDPTSQESRPSNPIQIVDITIFTR